MVVVLVLVVVVGVLEELVPGMVVETAGGVLAGAWARLAGVVVVLVEIREGMREMRGREAGAEGEGGERARVKECSEAEWWGESEAGEDAEEGGERAGLRREGWWW